MLIGRIKKLNAERGFGFIVPDDESPDVYFHRSVVPPAEFERLAEGLEVSFEVPSGEGVDIRKRRATVVQRYFGGVVLAKIGEGSIAPLRRHPRSRGRKPDWRGKET